MLVNKLTFLAHAGVGSLLVTRFSLLSKLWYRGAAGRGRWCNRLPHLLSGIIVGTIPPPVLLYKGIRYSIFFLLNHPLDHGPAVALGEDEN